MGLTQLAVNNQQLERIGANLRLKVRSLVSMQKICSNPSCLSSSRNKLRIKMAVRKDVSE